MEKKTYNICIEVLNRFQKAGILSHFTLIGSWSIYFYQYYFKRKNYTSFIKTLDIDFLISIPPKISKTTDIFNLIEDLGFIESFSGKQGYIKFKHPDLTVEFLVPEKGRGSDKPYQIPELKINAQPLRYLDFLLEHAIVVTVQGLKIKLPHPAAYALHKFIIFKRRSSADKKERDIEGALRVFWECIKHNEKDYLLFIFTTMPNKWQKQIIKNLKTVNETEVIDILSEKPSFKIKPI